jgi:hypothetical protein
LALACLGYAVATPTSLVFLCLWPLVLKRSVMSIFSFLIATVVCALPFYFSGMAI